MTIDVDEILALAAQGQWILLLAILIGAVVRLLKSDTPLPTVPPRWRSWLALGLGAVSGVLEAVVGGSTWAHALTDGLVAALTAIAGHDAVVGSLRGGREFFARATDANSSNGAFESGERP